MKEKIHHNLSTAFKDAEIDVTVEGNRCLVKIISSEFEGVRTVQRQQRVYACLNDMIASGELHAVTIQTHTPTELNRD